MGAHTTGHFSSERVSDLSGAQRSRMTLICFLSLECPVAMKGGVYGEIVE
jgi:hypothetical protein